MKLIVNQAYENMGLGSTQTLGPILDGYMRNTPEAREFIDVAEKEGVREVITRRDSPFGDYSAAPQRPAAEPEQCDRTEEEVIRTSDRSARPSVRTLRSLPPRVERDAKRAVFTLPHWSWRSLMASKTARWCPAWYPH